MRRNLIASVLLLSSATLALAEDAAKAPTAKAAAAKAGPARVAGTGPATESAKTLYALGLVLSQNLAPLKLSAADLASVQEGIADGVLGRPAKVDLQTYGPKIRDFANARVASGAEGEKKAGAAFLAKEAAENGAAKQPTGFLYKEIKAGTGASPKATDKVKVHYRGTLIDGTVFDSSIDRGEPVTFPLTGVIPCWTQGLQLMKTGGKARLVCPSDLAYGDTGSPPKIKGGATLVFEVELLSIEK
ncbi:MAG: FKBP-type peptidyl-prolyl cis-trans isomerase [Acidobacteriota bacterium]|jgi:FKBP-type peptidyl-prolyl cis-trans isomerase FkpA/FKBP-type peptidyl-prolyl cis-trans isomerase FklB